MQSRIGGTGSEMIISYGNEKGSNGMGSMIIKGGPSYAVTVTVAVLLPTSLVATKV